MKSLPLQAADTEATLMTLAARQHGVVTRSQMLAAGVPAHRLDWRLKAGRFSPLHRGVFLLGPLEVPGTKYMAAALACGDRAVVSHGSAAVVCELTSEPGDGSAIDVAIPSGDRRPPGIRVHRLLSLRPDETTRVRGIPVTTIPRTLLDVASVQVSRDLERVLATALTHRRTTRREILRMIERHAKRRGAIRLRAMLDAGQPAFTRSEAEELFLALIRKAELVMPEVNARIGGYEVDFCWRAQRFVVEIDGFAFHSSAGAFESDRRRDAVLAAAGIHVVRVTWRQIIDAPLALIGRLAQALARANAT